MISLFFILDRHPMGIGPEVPNQCAFPPRMAKPIAGNGSFFAFNLKIPFAAVLFSLFFNVKGEFPNAC
jgi:hypothetical protein